jgi:rare lipoprotein A
MKTHFGAPGRRLRIAGLAALMGMTGTAYAAAPAQEASSSEVTLAGAGSHQKLHYGQQLRLEGFAAHRAAGRSIRLEQSPGGRGWRPITNTSTRAGGAYAFAVRVRQSGAYRTVADSGGSSAPRRVSVAPRLGGHATRHVLRGHAVRVRGALRPGLGGRRLRVELRTRRGWKAVDRTRTGRGGRFSARWRPSGTGSFRVRVRFAGDRLNAAAATTLGGRVNVYRPTQASWYGPGFYGHRTACGGSLGAGTLGVANRWLPCGTRVTLRYRGRSVTVPVIDRGPFGGGREWDLTAATKSRLGFPDVGTVWATR